MAYVFDTSSFRVLGNYYPDQFPTFWQIFDSAVNNGRIISVSEVHRELGFYTRHPHITIWVENHKRIFLPPEPVERRFITKIFSIPHFQTLVKEKDRLAGNLCADPFVIAKAEFTHGCVVTEETLKPNAAKIPNVCEHFGIDCTNLQGFMKRENWDLLISL